MIIPTWLLDVDPTMKALSRGESTKGWDDGADAGEPDDEAERAEYAAALAALEGTKGDGK